MPPHDSLYLVVTSIVSTTWSGGEIALLTTLRVLHAGRASFFVIVQGPVTPVADQEIVGCPGLRTRIGEALRESTGTSMSAIPIVRFPETLVVESTLLLHVTVNVLLYGGDCRVTVRELDMAALVNAGSEDEHELATTSTPSQDKVGVELLGAGLSGGDNDKVTCGLYTLNGIDVQLLALFSLGLTLYVSAQSQSVCGEPPVIEFVEIELGGTVAVEPPASGVILVSFNLFIDEAVRQLVASALSMQ